MNKGRRLQNEIAIYKYWRTGMTDDKIAEKLHLSVKTVTNYRLGLRLAANQEPPAPPSLFDERKRVIKKARVQARRRGSTVTFDSNSVWCNAEFVHKYMSGDV